jgi:fucose 4-O-acetylase-like acetyltransferase
MVFVVYIHNGALHENVNCAAIDIHGYVGKIETAVQAIVRIAVPLFFIISAFLLYAKMPPFTSNLKKKCLTILLPYILWTTLITLYTFARQNLDPTIPSVYGKMSNFTFMDWLGAIAGYAGVFHEMPLAFQFWFIRDLFILNIFFVAIKKIVDICPAGVILLLFLLWIGNVKIYIISPEALLFFTLGYYIVKYGLDYRRLDAIKMRDAGIMYAMTIIASIFFKENFPALAKINILVGVIFFIRLSAIFVKSSAIYRPLSWLGQYAFWLYATHVILLNSMENHSKRILPPTLGGVLANYFLITLLCIIIIVGAGAVFKKVFPKTFSILTGGR